MLDKITFETICLGYNNENNWEHIAFDCKINGISFNYKMGMACARDIQDKGDVLLPSGKIQKIKAEGYTIKSIRKERRKNIVDDIKYFDVRILVKPPKLEDVLHCLFLDSQAHDESFDSWCDNLGYSSDSISAKAVYDACIDNYFKFKKALGVDYSEVKLAIEALEL